LFQNPNIVQLEERCGEVKITFRIATKHRYALTMMQQFGSNGTNGHMKPRTNKEVQWKKIMFDNMKYI